MVAAENRSLPPKVCREYKLTFVRKDALFSWQCSGSEIAAVVHLSDNASLENSTIHTQWWAKVWFNAGNSA
jgi:hypothetical protein